MNTPLDQIFSDVTDLILPNSEQEAAPPPPPTLPEEEEGENSRPKRRRDKFQEMLDEPKAPLVDRVRLTLSQVH